jgi:CRP/FNR family transcriptional regulator, cyclic AMP receptor protein
MNAPVDLSVSHPVPASRAKPGSRYRETLARIELFRSLDASAIADLDRQSTWRKYSRNDWIVERHDTGGDVFFVISGTVRVKIPESQGREVLFQDLDAGSYFGEMDAIDGKPRAIGVMAVTDVVIARMPREVFRTAICRHSDAADQVLVRLTGIIRALTDRVREFTTLDVKHRIYAELLRLSQQKNGEKDVAIISPPPVQAAIAARISTRRETVAREMKALERAGLIERKRGALVLKDTKTLQCLLKRDADCDNADLSGDVI